jgi:hypothetical protein
VFFKQTLVYFLGFFLLPRTPKINPGDGRGKRKSEKEAVRRGVEVRVGAAIINSPDAIDSLASLGEPQVRGDRFCHLFV